MTDAELVEIAARAYADAWRRDIGQHLKKDVSTWAEMGEPQRDAMRRVAADVLSTVRPHLEAAGREQAAKVAEAFCQEHATEGGEIWVLRRLADQLRLEGG